MSSRGLVGGRGLQIAVIGDADTVTGFLLAGVGAREQKATAEENFLIVSSSEFEYCVTV